MGSLGEGLEVLLIFIGLSTPIIVICLVYYFKKKLDNKEILAAIEKGMPLSELKPAKKRIISGPGWIHDLTKGIICLVIGVGLIPMVIIFLESQLAASQETQGVFAIFWILPLVFLGNGIGHVISGVLRRKHEKENIDSQQDRGLNS